MKVIKYTKMIFLFLLIGMNISCDQITKNEVRENVQKHEIIKVIDSNLILTNVENTGAAMSLGANLSPIVKLVVLKLFPLLLMIGLIGFLVTELNLPKFLQVGLACIIGGGIGNLIDRFKFDSVTDFMFVELGPFKTGIFNMADVSIVLGVVLILLTSIFGKKRKVLVPKM